MHMHMLLYEKRRRKHMLVYLPLLYSFPAMNLQNVKTEDQLVNPSYSLFPMFESRLHVDKDHNHST